MPSSCHEVASEAAGVLDDHDADAVPLDPVKQFVKSGPRLDRISAAYRRIIDRSAPEGDARSQA
jgi:hypothetical protein